MEYVLILYLYGTPNRGGAGGIAMETFKNESWCKSAGVKAEKSFYKVKYSCVPKGK